MTSCWKDAWDAPPVFKSPPIAVCHQEYTVDDLNEPSGATNYAELIITMFERKKITDINPKKDILEMLKKSKKKYEKSNNNKTV